MSKSLFAAAAALAMVATAPATARTQNDPGSAQAAAQKKDSRKICRTFQNSASRMDAKRLCLTKEQWKKFEAAQ